MNTLTRSLSLTIITAFFSFSLPLHAETSVWKVSKNDEHPALYLGGTIHMLRAEDHPLPEEFDKAYAASEELFFETDLDAANSPEFQAKMIRSLSFQDGSTLSQAISPRTLKKLTQYLTSRGMSIAFFNTLKPSGLSLTISVLELQRLGMNPALGVDATYNNKAQIDRKQVGALETIDEQLAFIQDMDNVDADKMILYTLKDIEKMASLLETMRVAWRSGDIKSLEADALIEMKSEFPRIYSTLIKKRNTAWMEKLLSMLTDENSEFVLVGALHLAGKDGLLQQLEKQGFTVKQL